MPRRCRPGRPARVTHAALIRFIASAYRAAGVPAADADKAADFMAQSDISSADAHGVFRLPQYIRRIQTGGSMSGPTSPLAAPRQARRWSATTGSALVVARAVETAIEIAGTQKVG